MTTQRTPLVTVEMATELSANDISEICDATEEAIEAGGGFGWLARLRALFWKITGAGYYWYQIIICFWPSLIM